MPKVAKFNPNKAGQRAFALAKEVAKLAIPQQHRVSAMHQLAGDYSAVPLDEEQKLLIATVGAHAYGAVCAVILADDNKEEEVIARQQYMRHLIQGIYTLGVLRGRDEAMQDREIQPLVETSRQLQEESDHV